MTTRLPLHPRPLADEALSSWVRRLGAAYDLTPDRFIESALGLSPPAGFLGVIDNEPPNDLVEALSERTGTSAERVSAMTLAGYGSLLLGASASISRSATEIFVDYVCQFTCLSPAGPRRTAPVTQLSTRWRPWICADLLDDRPRSCRRCLITDPIPYTRIHWRAAWMVSCPIHEVALEPLGQGCEGMAARSYDWAPAQLVHPVLLALDRLTLEAVTAGVIALPSGRRLHAGIWLRALRSLVDELIRSSGVLRCGAYARVTRLWRDAGRAFHEGIPRAPFEMFTAEQREAVLMIAGLTVQKLNEGAPSLAVRASKPLPIFALLRPPPTTGPDLPSRPSSPTPSSDGPVAEAIAAARANPREAYRIRQYLIRREHAENVSQLDRCLIELGFPIVTEQPLRLPAGTTRAAA